MVEMLTLSLPLGGQFSNDFVLMCASSLPRSPSPIYVDVDVDVDIDEGVDVDVDAFRYRCRCRCRFGRR